MTSEEADAQQQERAKDAGRRSASEPVPVASLVGSIEAARAAWERRRLSVLESECPDCEVDSARARVCTFRGQDVCRFAAEIQHRGRVKTLEANLRHAHAPQAFWPAILAGDVGQTSAVGAARRIVAGEGRLAVFAGGPGQGKSFGAAVALAERGGWFQPASGLDPFGKEANELLAHCARVGLLVLDDAGAGRSNSDVAKQRLEQLVRERWDDDLPTIVTTNLTKETFWPLYGGPLGRIADRLGSDPVGWVRCVHEHQRGAR